MKTKKIVVGPVTKKAAGARKKAVAIARDVIAQLRMKKLRAEMGSYIDIDLKDDAGCSISLDNEESFRKTYQQSSGHCTVCAIGAAFVSYVNRYNRVTNSDIVYIDDDEMIDYLGDAFSAAELRFMERIFENEWVNGDSEWVEENFDVIYEEIAGDFEGKDEAFEAFDRRCGDYHKKYMRGKGGGPDKLLRAIMLNVVRNNGIFKLPQRV